MISYFFDPILRGPTWGTLLMSFSAALAGVFVFARKRSLLGEALSHATYPGVTLATLLCFYLDMTHWLSFFILGGAFLSALWGVRLIRSLTDQVGISRDAALCAILAATFGIGITVASFLQYVAPNAFRQIEVYLFGQAASMTDGHIVLYAAFAAVTVIIVSLFYKELVAISFDVEFAATSGINSKMVDKVWLVLLVLAVVIGMRSVGVVLMSAMLIAPVSAARQWTHSFLTLCWLSCACGSLSAVIGVVLSTTLSTQTRTLPTGPTIVLVAASLALLSLLVGSKGGLFVRLYRHMRCQSKSLKVVS